MSQNKIPVLQIRIDYDYHNLEIHPIIVSWDFVYSIGLTSTCVEEIKSGTW